MRLAGWAAVLVIGGIAAAAAGCGGEDVTVTTPTKSGPPKETTVRLKMADGTSWSCPLATGSKLQPYKQRMGRLALQRRPLRRELKLKDRQLKKLTKLYPGGAPTE